MRRSPARACGRLPAAGSIPTPLPTLSAEESGGRMSARAESGTGCRGPDAEAERPDASSVPTRVQAPGPGSGSGPALGAVGRMPGLGAAAPGRGRPRQLACPRVAPQPTPIGCQSTGRVPTGVPPWRQSFGLTERFPFRAERPAPDGLPRFRCLSASGPHRPFGHAGLGECSHGCRRRGMCCFSHLGVGFWVHRPFRRRGLGERF
jgi:hypothetical protein